MNQETFLSSPPRPPSEVEWEDLLVRLELMPRALRFALEGPKARPAGLLPILSQLVDREVWAVRLLDAATREPSVTPLAPDGAERRGNERPVDVQGQVDRFVRFRSRTFSMVQRRGIEVWDWVLRTEEVELTPYQLLSHLVRSDVETLAALRGFLSQRTGEC